MTLIRDSVATRRETLYRMLWYRCPQCQDVGFSQRPASELDEQSTGESLAVIRSVEVHH